MAEALALGKWDLESSENFDEYMKALGVGMATRLIGNSAKPSQDISITDGLWHIVTSTKLSKVEIKFRLGEEFDETTADGRKVKTTFTVDGNKLIQDQKGETGSHMVREFTEDSFVMTLKAKDVTCVRKYKRVK